MAIVTIIGAGQMASALTFPLFENRNEIRLVGTPLDEDIIAQLRKNDYHPKLRRTLHHGIQYYTCDEMDDVIRGTDVFLCGVSSFGVNWFAECVVDRIPAGIPVISVTKGMIKADDGTMISYPEYWESRRKSGKISINAIGGPCTSYELADHDHSEVVFCGRSIMELRKLRDIFATNYYHVNISTDVRGVECAVALKNAFALGVSLTIGLCEKREGKGIQHYNSQAAAFTESVVEMRKLLQIFTGTDEALAFGVGDLYVTIFGGRTRKIGKLLGYGLTYDEAMLQLKDETLESVVITRRMADAIRRMAARGEVKEADFPLLLHVDNVLDSDVSRELPWDKFTREYSEGS